LVVVDYVSKWVEAIPNWINNNKVIASSTKRTFSHASKSFVISSVIMALIEIDLLKLAITHKLSILYHPQTSGQIEVSNR